MNCVFIDLKKAYDQNSEGRVVVLYEEIRSDRKVCETGAGYVRE